MDGMEARQARHALLLVLISAKEAVQPLAAARLLGLSPLKVEHALGALRGAGLAAQAAEGWLPSPELPSFGDALQDAAEDFSGREGLGGAPEVVRGLGLCARGDVFEGVGVLLEQVRQLSFSAATSAALCLKLILAVLEPLDLDKIGEEARRRHVLTVIELADVAAGFSLMTKDICPLLDKAIECARRSGDRRSVAMLHIIKAHMLTFAAFNLSQEADSLFQTGFEMGKSFGDSDMLEYVATYLGFRHMLQGHFLEAVRHLEVVRESFTLPKTAYWWSMFYAMASFFVGFDRQAVGVLESCWRTAELRGDRLAGANWRLHLAMLLLMAGKRQAARVHLEALRGTIGEDALPVMRIRLNWTLGLLRFLDGDVTGAHAMFVRSARISRDMSVERPDHHLPWILRMLYAFRRAGLPDLPGAGLDAELERALASSRGQLRASAWQVRGRMLLDEAGDPEGARRAFKSALKEYLGVGNPVEAARVKLELADAEERAGRTVAAGRLREDACAVNLAFGQPQWPEGLPRPRAERPWRSLARAALARRSGDGEEIFRVRSRADVYQRLFGNFCRDLRVEQGALFALGEDGIARLATVNLSPLQLENVVFARFRNWLRMEGASSQIARREGPEGHAVCVPLKRGEARFVVYLCNAYFTAEMDALGNAELRAAAEAFCENLQLAEGWDARPGGAEQAGGDLVILPHGEPDALVTRDGSMRQLLRRLGQSAATGAPVLIMGETGVGKELLARQIHKLSGRKGPFVSVHPASMTETLFESAFFGHEKGAFTGATSQKIGFFELADKGTLFIDEVGEMPLSMQTKFLRVLQEHTFIRVGGLREIRSDFRLVTATNRDLEKEVAAGDFRQDLYYRLSVVPLLVPPLRTRGGDAVVLAQHFLSLFTRKYQRRNVTFSRDDLARIAAYPWPGNVRELENVIERAVILAGEGPLELSLTVPGVREPGPKPCPEAPPQEGQDLLADRPTLEELERRYIKRILEQTNGRIRGEGGAEAILGIGRSTLYAKIRRYGIKSRRLYD